MRFAACSRPACRRPNRVRSSTSDPSRSGRPLPPAGAVYHYVMDQTSSFGPDSGADTLGVNTLRIAFTQKVGVPDADGVPITFTFDSTKVKSPMLNPAAADQAVERLKDIHLTTIYDDHLRLGRDRKR